MSQSVFRRRGLSWMLGAALLGLPLLWLPQAARGAAAGALADTQTKSRRAKTVLSAGAVTTDPALRQIALTFDPASNTPAGTMLAIQDFQLDVQYDALNLNIFSITAVDGFDLTSLGNNSTPGLIDDIQGLYDFSSLNTNTGDQNFFKITFKLKAGVDPATLLTFKFFANDSGDNLSSLDLDDIEGGTFKSNGPSTDISPDPGEIIPAIVTASVANGVSPGVVPLPAGAWAGALTLALAGLAGLCVRGRAG